MHPTGQIFIGENALKQLTQFLTHPFSNCFVLVDENTLKHGYPHLQNILPPHQLIQIQSGELHKTLATCAFIWTKLTEANADRKSLLINLGGGVIGDMGGFAAACYKRGIQFINIPTTLLAMVDASVGGKTGIDFKGFKNQIGLFAEPSGVFIHPGFLVTLPPRQLLSGFAEVIKHYLIADKNSFYQILNLKPAINQLNWQQIITQNVNIKSVIVAHDPHENGSRKALNFGHTIGHAVESWLLGDEEFALLHGEAVAIGMIAESYLSHKKGLLLVEELTSATQLILYYFNLPAIDTEAIPGILTLIKQDKKTEQHTTQFTLLHGIGNYAVNNAVEEGLIVESLYYYNSLLK